MGRGSRKRGKRKRKAFRPLPFVLLVCGLLLCLLVAGLLFVRSAVDRWLTGGGFEDWVVAKAGEALRSEVALDGVEWEGRSSVYAESFRARGTQGAAFSALEVEGVRAVNGGVGEGAFRIPEVTVNRLKLGFGEGQEKAARTEGADASGGASGTGVAGSASRAAGPDLPEWIASRLPRRVEVGEIRVAAANVEVAGEATGGVESGAGAGGRRGAGEKAVPGAVFALRSVRTVMRPDFEQGVWEIDGQGGRLELAGRPDLRLKQLGLRWQGEALFVRKCALGVFGNGHVDGRGEVDFAKGGLFDLDLDVSGIAVDEVIGREWRERLSGTIRGPVRITGKAGDLVHEGTLHVDGAVVEKVPALARVGRYTRSKKFERLVLNEVRADFKRRGEVIEIRDLAAQSDGLLRVEGDIDVRGKLLDGALRVGVAPGVLSWIPGAEQRVFTRPEKGFLWADVKLAGTVDEPREDLSGQLVAAAGAEILGDLPGEAVNQVMEILGAGRGAAAEAPDAGSGSDGDEPAEASESDGHPVSPIPVEVEGVEEEVIEQGRRMFDALGPLLN